MIGADGWFTTAEDREEGRGRVDLARIASPGALAAGILSRFRVRPPAETFALSEGEGQAWAETVHGGWCSADPRLLGTSFEAVAPDITACHPLMAHHIGWWPLVTANRVRRREVTAALRRSCRRAAANPCSVLDPAVIRRFGCCLVEGVRADFDVLPIEVEDERRPDGRLEVVPVHSINRPLNMTALDLLASAVLTDKSEVLTDEVVDFERATVFEPIGRQHGLRQRLPITPGLVLNVDDDINALVRHRREATARNDLELAAVLRVVLNALIFGIFCRGDDVLLKDGREWVIAERPGPWVCLPIASSVVAGSRLMLAVLDRLVRDLGGIIAYRDTDCGIIPASPAGGKLDLSDGSVVRSLSYREVEEVLGAFAPLSPAPWWPVWSR